MEKSYRRMMMMTTMMKMTDAERASPSMEMEMERGMERGMESC